MADPARWHAAGSSSSRTSRCRSAGFRRAGLTSDHRPPHMAEGTGPHATAGARSGAIAVFAFGRAPKRPTEGRAAVHAGRKPAGPLRSSTSRGPMLSRFSFRKGGLAAHFVGTAEGGTYSHDVRFRSGAAATSGRGRSVPRRAGVRPSATPPSSSPPHNTRRHGRRQGDFTRNAPGLSRGPGAFFAWRGHDGRPALKCSRATTRSRSVVVSCQITEDHGLRATGPRAGPFGQPAPTLPLRRADRLPYKHPRPACLSHA